MGRKAQGIGSTKYVAVTDSRKMTSSGTRSTKNKTTRQDSQGREFTRSSRTEVVAPYTMMMMKKHSSSVTPVGPKIREMVVGSNRCAESERVSSFVPASFSWSSLDECTSTWMGTGDHLKTMSFVVRSPMTISSSIRSPNTISTEGRSPCTTSSSSVESHQTMSTDARSDTSSGLFSNESDDDSDDNDSFERTLSSDHREVSDALVVWNMDMFHGVFDFGIRTSPGPIVMQDIYPNRLRSCRVPSMSPRISAMHMPTFLLRPSTEFPSISPKLATTFTKMHQKTKDGWKAMDLKSHALMKGEAMPLIADKTRYTAEQRGGSANELASEAFRHSDGLGVGHDASAVAELNPKRSFIAMVSTVTVLKPMEVLEIFFAVFSCSKSLGDEDEDPMFSSMEKKVEEDVDTRSYKKTPSQAKSRSTKKKHSAAAARRCKDEARDDLDTLATNRERLPVDTPREDVPAHDDTDPAAVFEAQLQLFDELKRKNRQSRRRQEKQDTTLQAERPASQNSRKNVPITINLRQQPLATTTSAHELPSALDLTSDEQTTVDDGTPDKPILTLQDEEDRLRQPETLSLDTNVPSTVNAGQLSPTSVFTSLTTSVFDQSGIENISEAERSPLLVMRANETSPFHSGQLSPTTAFTRVRSIYTEEYPVTSMLKDQDESRSIDHEGSSLSVDAGAGTSESVAHSQGQPSPTTALTPVSSSAFDHPSVEHIQSTHDSSHSAHVAEEHNESQGILKKAETSLSMDIGAEKVFSHCFGQPSPTSAFARVSPSVFDFSREKRSLVNDLTPNAHNLTGQQKNESIVRAEWSPSLYARTIVPSPLNLGLPSLPTASSRLSPAVFDQSTEKKEPTWVPPADVHNRTDSDSEDEVLSPSITSGPPSLHVDVGLPVDDGVLDQLADDILLDPPSTLSTERLLIVDHRREIFMGLKDEGKSSHVDEEELLLRASLSSFAAGHESFEMKLSFTEDGGASIQLSTSCLSHASETPVPVDDYETLNSQGSNLTDNSSTSSTTDENDSAAVRRLILLERRASMQARANSLALSTSNSTITSIAFTTTAFCKPAILTYGIPSIVEEVSPIVPVPPSSRGPCLMETSGKILAMKKSIIMSRQKHLTREEEDVDEEEQHVLTSIPSLSSNNTASLSATESRAMDSRQVLNRTGKLSHLRKVRGSNATKALARTSSMSVASTDQKHSAF